MEAAKGEILFAGAQRKQAGPGEPSQLDIEGTEECKQRLGDGPVFSVSCRNH